MFIGPLTQTGSKNTSLSYGHFVFNCLSYVKDFRVNYFIGTGDLVSETSFEIMQSVGKALFSTCLHLMCYILLEVASS